MSTLALLFLIILGAIFSGLLVWLLIVVLREEEETEQYPIFFNLMSNYALPDKGYAVGIIRNITMIENRYYIEYKPTTLSLKKIKQIKEIPMQKVIIDKDKLITMPKGTLDSDRDILIGLAPNPEDYSSAFKHTFFGESMMKLTEKINVDNVESHIIREGSIRKTNLLDDLGAGEISSEWITTKKEIDKDLIKSIVETKSASTMTKPTTYSSPSSSTT